jgi:palmitoyltransferase
LSVWAFYVGVGRVCVPAMRQDDRAGFSRGAGSRLARAARAFRMLTISRYSCCIYHTLADVHVVIRCSECLIKCTLLTMRSFSRLQDMREMRVPSARTSSDAQHVPKSDGPPLAPVNPYTYPILDTEEWGASPLRPPPNALLENPMTPTPAPMLEPAERSERTLVTDPLIPHLNETPARVQRPVPPVTMFPRWCQYCEIIKPPRTHHCRHCGTCVLQFDREWRVTVYTLTG